MQVVDFSRLLVHNSSTSAFLLAVDNHKYTEFASKLIRAKNDNAYHQLTSLQSHCQEYLQVEKKIEKYQALLYMIDNVYSIAPLADRQR